MSSTGAPTTAARVLVVEHDPAVRDWMVRVLSRAGYAVTTAATAAAGSRAATARPHLIICHVNLPDADGIEWVAHLRQDPRTADIPVLQTSAVRIAAPDRAAGLRAGADAYLVQPTDRDELLAVVAALLRARDAERQAGTALTRLTRLQAATAALARASTDGEILHHLAEAVRNGYGAVGIGLAVLGPDGMLTTRLDEAAPFSLTPRWPADSSTPFGRAVVEQTPVLIRNRDQRTRDFPALGEQVVGVDSSVDYPLCAPDGRALGALGAGFPAGVVLDDALVDDLQAIAELTGQALHRTQLDAAVRATGARLQVLQDLTAALSRAPDRRTIATASLHHLQQALASDHAVVLVEDGPDVLVLRETGGEGGRAAPHPLPAELRAAATTLIQRRPLFDDQAADAPEVDGPDQALDQSRAALRRLLPDRPPAARGALPLQSGGRPFGVLCFSRAGDRAVPPAERELARAITAHTADALLRADIAERERAAFLELQHQLLPRRLPQPPGWSLTGRYAPAAGSSAVGGDWYDAVAHPDGRLTLVIGDVAGHGTPAAATMSQLRHTLHAYLTAGMPPERALGHLEDALDPDLPSYLATVLIVSLDPAATTLTAVTAGHPPALLITSDGQANELTPPPNRPLGVTRGQPYTAISRPWPGEATLLLYTDGLIERRGESLDTGLQRLREAVPLGLDVAATADQVLRRCRSDDDDTALLVARHAVPTGPTRARHGKGVNTAER